MSAQLQLNTEVGILGILPLISLRFGISTATSGLFVSLFALMIAVFGAVMPVVLRNVNRRKLMLTTLALFAASNVIGGLVTNFGLALVFRLLPAVLHPVYCSLAFTMAAEVAAPGQASKAVSRVMIGVSAGTVLGTPITTLIANNLSYSAALDFFALVNLAALILNFAMLPKQSTANTTATTAEPALSQVLGKRALWISGLGTVLIGSVLFVVYGYVSDFLGQLSGFLATQLSLTLFIFGLMSIVGNLIAGNLLSRTPRRLVTSYPVLLAIVYMLLLVFAHSGIVMYGIIVLWGIVYGIGNNLQQYLISAAIPEALSLANGLFISLGNVGTALGTSLGGVFLSSLGLGLLPAGGIGILIVTLLVVLVRNRVVHQELTDVAD